MWRPVRPLFSKAGTTSANRFWLGNINLNPVDGSKMVVVSKVSVLTAGRQLIISNKNILRKSSRFAGRVHDYRERKNLTRGCPQTCHEIQEIEKQPIPPLYGKGT